MRTIIFKPFFLATGLIACCLSNINAQKLPNVQQTAVRAPANVKVDGKPTEWNNKFEAYNTAADVWYTMANDNDNLYLVIQASKLNMVNTIAGYGFELAIHKSGRKNDADKVSTIRYPEKTATLLLSEVVICRLTRIPHLTTLTR